MSTFRGYLRLSSSRRPRKQTPDDVLIPRGCDRIPEGHGTPRSAVRTLPVILLIASPLPEFGGVRLIVERKVSNEASGKTRQGAESTASVSSTIF